LYFKLEAEGGEVEHIADVPKSKTFAIARERTEGSRRDGTDVAAA